MAKCANCSSDAFYTYAITKSYGIDYCSRHVPKFLQRQKKSGMMPLRVPVAVVEPAPTAPKTSKKKAAVVEPVVEVVEEPVVEEAPTD